MATRKTTSAPTKKAAAKKAPAKKAAAKKAPAKKAAAKKAPVKKAPAKKAPAKKAAPVKKAPAKKAAAKKAPAKKAAAKKAPARKSPPPKKESVTTTAPAKKTATKKTAPAKKAAAKKAAPVKKATPVKRAPSKDGIVATKDFDLKFLRVQKDLLLSERASLTGQADRLEDEANSLIEEAEMGDVQFDEESGEGDTMVVERERDLALSAQARQMIVEIDEALERIAEGTYGYSVASGRPIPRERLEAIPWTSVLVEEKAGGIGRL